MRTTSCLATLLLFSFTCFGQTTRPVLIGLDVAKPLLSLVTPNRPAFRLAEATIKVPILRERYLSAVGGYGAYRSNPAFRNVLIDAQGLYLKIGAERFSSAGLLVG